MANENLPGDWSFNPTWTAPGTDLEYDSVSYTMETDIFPTRFKAVVEIPTMTLETYEDFCTPAIGESSAITRVRRKSPIDTVKGLSAPFQEDSILAKAGTATMPARYIRLRTELETDRILRYSVCQFPLADGSSLLIPVAKELTYYLVRHVGRDLGEFYYEYMLTYHFCLSELAYAELYQQLSLIPNVQLSLILSVVKEGTKMYRLPQLSTTVSKKRIIPRFLIEAQLLLFSNITITDDAVNMTPNEILSRFDTFYWVGMFSCIPNFWELYTKHYVPKPDFNCELVSLTPNELTKYAEQAGFLKDDKGNYKNPVINEVALMGLAHIMLLAGHKVVRLGDQATNFSTKRSTAFFNAVNQANLKIGGSIGFLQIAERICAHFPTLYVLTISCLLKTPQVGLAKVMAEATTTMLKGSGMTMFCEIDSFVLSGDNAALLHPIVIAEAREYLDAKKDVLAICEEQRIDCGDSPQIKSGFSIKIRILKNIPHTKTFSQVGSIIVRVPKMESCSRII